MKYNEEVIDGYEVCYSSDWIFNLEKKIHFEWYYHQANLVYGNCTRDQNILEIGIGTGLLSDLLKKRGWNILTIDIDKEKKPDFCANALDFNYEKHSIDVVLAFEIFEHIPFTTFQKVLKKLSAHGVKKVFFSLPYNEKKLFELSIKIPRINRLNFQISIPVGKINTRAHFWELAKKSKLFEDSKRLVDYKALEKEFFANGYILKKTDKVDYIQYFSASIA